jgi:hypothetical protein
VAMWLGRDLAAWLGRGLATWLVTGDAPSSSITWAPRCSLLAENVEAAGPGALATRLL